MEGFSKFFGVLLNFSFLFYHYCFLGLEFSMFKKVKKFVLETCSSILEKYSDYSMVRCIETVSVSIPYQSSILLSVSCFQCAEIIKNMMDENYGGAGYWNVIVGESFDVGS